MIHDEHDRHDGTSQAARVLPELDPDSARIDERDSADLLEFARQYARELKYFALDNPNEACGDWSGFVEGDTSRPHFALFLTFLELLAHARARINTLTRRHLEFYYRDVLRMVRKRARPDSVHVLVELDERTGELRVPAGTALNAGKDSLGRDLAYCTDRELIAHRTQVAQVSALRAQIHVTGIREAAEQCRVSGASQDEDAKQNAFVAMLRIALGQPGPGDPLPVPVYPGNPPVPAIGQPQPQVTFSVLLDAYNRVKSTQAERGPPRFDDFRTRMRLRAAHSKDDGFNDAEEELFEEFTAVEAYFHMTAECFCYIMSVAQDPGTTPQSWARVYEIVTAAHHEMIYAKRRAALLAQVQPDLKVPIPDATKACDEMLTIVLGEKVPDAKTWQRRLKDLGVFASDVTYLASIADKSEPQPDWLRAARVLEVAQRNREGFRDPVPEKVEWRNLYSTADAKKSWVGAQVGSGALPRWKPFGAGESQREQPMLPASFGWALASPLLWLQEGERTIELSLAFADGPQFSIGNDTFRVELSTVKGWIDASTVTLKSATLPKLTLSVTLAAGQPALAALSRAVHGIDTPVPVIRLLLNPQWQKEGRPAYAWLRKLSLMTARLVVSVTGLSSLSIANDDTVLDARKPFEPFGMAPVTGSRFYLGHPEIVGKKLELLTFNIVWMGVPASLATHYLNYPDKSDSASFKAKVSLFDSGVQRKFSDPEIRLFGDATTTCASASPKLPADQGLPDVAACTAAEVTRWGRYIVWELGTPDFQHTAYPSVALKMLSTEDCPPPPYTPKIRSLTVDYKAAEIVFDAALAAPAAMQLYHVHPFGFAELKPEGKPPGCAFLPQFDFEGELYIGLRHVVAPQNVSLLFQVAEGSADPRVEPAPLQWSYLSANRWINLHDEGGLLADGTRGFINSGIVELSLKPAQPSTLLPDGLYWIRAAIPRAPEGVCDMIEIHPNAVSATFADAGNAPDHLAAPLAAGTLSATRLPIAGIDRILQPYTSFGGKMAEADSSFHVRVSERLRHKERALTAWDYERLVLEKFPQLHKVKCLRGDVGTAPREPGAVELIVIPDVRNRLPFNPFEPKAPAGLIRDIEAFLADKTPPFAKVKVKNARYVPVKVRCGVRFVPGHPSSTPTPAFWPF